MNKEELLKEIMELPKAETDNPISTTNSINIDDLMSAVDRLNKVPTYDELLRENKKQKEVIDKTNKVIDEMINTGYSKGTFYYWATGNDSEFGARAEIIKDILKEVSE